MLLTLCRAIRQYCFSTADRLSFKRAVASKVTTLAAHPFPFQPLLQLSSAVLPWPFMEIISSFLSTIFTLIQHMDGRSTSGKTEAIVQGNRASQASLTGWLETFTGHPASQSISSLFSFSWSILSMETFKPAW